MENKWISINDKTPKDNQEVITYFEVTGIEISKYEDVSKEDGGIWGCNMFINKSGWLTDDVTHWMPLPPCPTT